MKLARKPRRKRSETETRPTKIMRPSFKPSGTSEKKFTRRLCANRKRSMMRKGGLELRRIGRSAKSSARRTKRSELEGESGMNRDVLSASVCAKNNRNLMNKEIENETKDTSDVDEKSVKDIGIGGASAVGVAAGLEIGNESEAETETETGTGIGIATGRVTAPQAVVLTVPYPSDLAILRQCPRTRHLRPRDRPRNHCCLWMRNRLKRLLYKCC